MIVYLYCCATRRHLVLEMETACSRCGSDRLVPLDWQEKPRKVPPSVEGPSRAEKGARVAGTLPEPPYTSQQRRFAIERQLAIERRERDERRRGNL